MKRKNILILIAILVLIIPSFVFASYYQHIKGSSTMEIAKPIFNITKTINSTSDTTININTNTNNSNQNININNTN